MHLRRFLQAAALSTAGVVVVHGQKSQAAGPVRRRKSAFDRGTFAVDANKVRLFSSAIAQPVRLMLIADTHLYKDDDRGAPFRQYSARMAKAYNQTRHFQTREATNPESSFERTLQIAAESKADLVALVGDILSFPSEAAVEWVHDRMQKSGLSHLYVAGNHDWHYEGMDGTLEELRSTWIRQRLQPLYRGDHPLMTSRVVRGIRVVALDNSHYEILPEQLDFYRKQAAIGQPLILFVHIPLYAPGRSVGFGCGHPDWGARSDRNFELERRQRWPVSGHTKTTMAFHREVFATPNLLGIFAGHIHKASLDVVKGVPQFVSEANATGAYLDIECIPHV